MMWGLWGPSWCCVGCFGVPSLCDARFLYPMLVWGPPTSPVHPMALVWDLWVPSGVMWGLWVFSCCCGWSLGRSRRAVGSLGFFMLPCWDFGSPCDNMWVSDWFSIGTNGQGGGKLPYPHWCELRMRSNSFVGTELRWKAVCWIHHKPSHRLLQVSQHCSKIPIPWLRVTPSG